MDTIGVAVVGVGYMGAIHARTYAAEPRAHLVGVFDANPETARSVAAEVGAAAFAGLDELLARPDVEAVSICTPDADHVQPTLAALEAGKHVLLEKPIATTMADADRIVAAAETSPGPPPTGARRCRSPLPRSDHPSSAPRYGRMRSDRGAVATGHRRILIRSSIGAVRVFRRVRQAHVAYLLPQGAQHPRPMVAATAFFARGNQQAGGHHGGQVTGRGRRGDLLSG